MNNNVLQALLHFFKDTDTNQPIKWDKKKLADNLHQFGVSMAELEKLFASISGWFASQAQRNSSVSQKFHNYPIQPHTGTRVYSASECAKISKKSRVFLSHLEALDILTPQLREMVIDNLVNAYSTEGIKMCLSRTQWITLQTTLSEIQGVGIAYLEWLLLRDMVELH